MTAAIFTKKNTLTGGSTYGASTPFCENKIDRFEVKNPYLKHRPILELRAPGRTAGRKKIFLKKLFLQIPFHNLNPSK